jgi:imidazole glycerol phosphate synthase glutamine amidotransferase subunit
MSRDEPVRIVPTGAGNLASLRSAIRRAGRDAAPISGTDEILSAEFLVLPGVGAFGAAMARLAANGAVEPLRERIRRGRPTLAICLGFQLLACASEESPGVGGLGAIEGRVEAIPRERGLRRTHVGWSRVEGSNLGPDFANFAHGYLLRAAPVGWSVAWSDYGGPFVAAMRRGPIVATQFHPELSGPFGAAIIENALSGRESW